MFKYITRLEQLERRLRKEEAVNEAIKQSLGLTVVDCGDGVLEVIKATEAEGSYTDPIEWTAGHEIVQDAWYWLDAEFAGKELPHQAIKSGAPMSFYDRDYFDFVEEVSTGGTE